MLSVVPRIESDVSGGIQNQKFWDILLYINIKGG